MGNQDQPKWYFKTWSLVASFICVGPFMLPLVWTNPRFNKKSKITITVVVVITTFILSAFLAKSIENIISYYQLAFSNLNL